VLELIKRFGKGYGGRCAIGVITKALEVVFNLIAPVIVARMIDIGVGTHDTGYVIRMGAVLIALSLVGYAFTLVCQKMAALISQGMGTDLRRALFHHVSSFGAAEVDEFGTASLVTRVTNDVNQIQVAVALAIRQLVRWPLLAVGSMVAALMLNLRLGLIFLVCTPLIGLVFWYVMSRSVPFFQTMQGKLDRISRIAREGLSGARVIRSFRREDAEKARFHEVAVDQTDTAIAVSNLSAWLSPSTFLVMNLGIVAILWAGGRQVDAGLMSQGEIVAFVNYMIQTLQSVVYVANLVVIFTRASASAQRIVEVLDAKPAVTEKPGAVAPQEDAAASSQALVFDHVCFAYAGSSADALHEVSFALPAGHELGIIGGTGSGKSTLAGLVLRLYDVRSGSVAVCGQDVRDWPLAALRQVVSIVPQQASLVTGTIRSNLLWRDGGASDDALWQALELAQAADFVRKKPGGLDAVVEAGGKNFSGGQRQRLTIARALVGSPQLVVLDDAASALDFATDAALRHALRSLRPAVSSVVISQRVSAVMDADLVLVLDHGAAIGLGTHRELLDGCPLYREICLTQLRPEELGRDEVPLAGARGGDI
jgi:ATP-binding cassette subfamily B multidrug efflux pump